MKAAPALGVSGDQATSGIMDGISGQLSKQTQFGTRLFMEAGDAISKATGGAIKDLKQFNAARRVSVPLIISCTPSFSTINTPPPPPPPPPLPVVPVGSSAVNVRAVLFCAWLLAVSLMYQKSIM